MPTTGRRGWSSSSSGFALIVKLREQRRQQRLNVELSALGSLIAKYPDEARGMLARLATSTVPATQMEGTVPDPTLQS
jgi:hypothetical protein